MPGISTPSAPSPLLSPSLHHLQPSQHHQRHPDALAPSLPRVENPELSLSLPSPSSPSPLSPYLTPLQSPSSPSPVLAHTLTRSPSLAPAPDRNHAAVDLPEPILTFSEIPSDLLRLDPLVDSSITSNLSSHSNSVLAHVNPSLRQRRKPSPGLAARLRALGFGSTNKDSNSQVNASQLDVGRLPEDQLRSLDLNHQLHSTALVVERRGRPWKGAGTPLQLLRSRSSRESFRSKGADHKKAIVHEETRRPSKPELLPEISQVQPLEMDASKYVLQEHDHRGHGTKASLSTRRGTFEQDTRPLSLDHDDDSSPPPPPPPKDTPERSQNSPASSNPLGLHRTGSIYTISRTSFTNQLAQLIALQLPDAELLSNKVAAIPTAQAAARALIGAAEQIRSWIAKASEVIEGLDSEDDVEWAAAGGREGYEEVENAISRFEELINVYVTAIEAMQGREDIASVSNDDLQDAVTQMELIMVDWTKIRKTLNNAKGQVETAMEWEELWNMVLGDIQNEMDDLSRLVFEMEERRHKSIMAVSSGDGVDINDLETIVEETPPTVARNNRYSMPSFPLSPSSPDSPPLTQDDSSLLALFARMQPLRASLDFLPMRLSAFQARAEGAFPTACEELAMRRSGLEASYKKLEKDADSLRKELGEDKWVLVFRGAGRQAQKLVESVDRSIAKLRESVDQGLQFSNPPMMSKKIENYEAKKIHYGPAIERVLSIIDKGVKDRLTVNGEILRLHTEMQSRWEEMKRQMRDMDNTLEEIQADKRSQRLRDSVSSLLSNDRSTVASGNETPGSSPPSSVALGYDPSTPRARSKTRSASTSSSIPQSSARRFSSMLAPPPRRSQPSRLSSLSSTTGSTTTPVRNGSMTPLGSRPPKSASSGTENRPRWSQYINPRDSDIGHHFKSLNLGSPSPYSKMPHSPTYPSTPVYQESKLPLRSPLSRRMTTSPGPDHVPSRANVPSRLSFRERIMTASPAPHIRETVLTAKELPASDARRSSLHSPKLRGMTNRATQRSVSSLATSRRTSLLPLPKHSSDSVSTGRASVAGSHKSHIGTDSVKPRWRY